MRTQLFVSFLLASCAIGCGDNQDEEGAKDLIGRIEEDEYRDWQRAPGFPGREGSSAPHGDSVEIYINDVVVDALENESDLEEWPTGSIIVKRGYDGGDYEFLAIMEKVDTGEWFWVEEIKGDIDYSGKPDVCIDCHRGGDDHVLAFDLP